MVTCMLHAQQFKVGDSVRVSEKYLKRQMEIASKENPQVILVPSQLGVVKDVRKKFPGYYMYRVNYVEEMIPDSVLDEASLKEEMYTVYTEVWLRKKYLRKK